MFNGQVISTLLEKKKAKKKDLYSYADISRATLDNIISGKTLPSVKVLEPIADFFDVSLDIFFERKVATTSSYGNRFNIYGSRNRVQSDFQMGDPCAEIKHLEDLLAEKERLIQVLLKNQKDV